MAYDVLTFGEALVEIMRPGIDQPLDQPGTFVGPYASGSPFIFAVQVARLGARTACIGAVGDDAFGRYLLASFAADGLDTDVVRVLPGHATGMAFVAYAADGSRDFVFHIRQAAAGQLDAGLLHAGQFDGLRCLHIAGSSLAIHDAAYGLGLEALQRAQAAGVMISFDPNIRPQLIDLADVREQFAPFVTACDVLLPTPDELALLTGIDDERAAAERLVTARSGRVVVVHAAEQGCRVYQLTRAGLRIDPIPAYTVEAVDPTGAGDCFAAGFLVRRLAGDDPVTAAQFASACGALACTQRGPMAGAQPADAVYTFMSTQSTKG